MSLAIDPASLAEDGSRPPRGELVRRLGARDAPAGQAESVRDADRHVWIGERACSTVGMRWRHRGLPDDWLPIVESNVALWQLFDEGERDLLEGTSDWLLRHKHWEAGHGFELDDEIVVTIAVLASLLLVGL